jgi:hypothetical protein
VINPSYDGARLQVLLMRAKCNLLRFSGGEWANSTLSLLENSLCRRLSAVHFDVLTFTQPLRVPDR